MLQRCLPPPVAAAKPPPSLLFQHRHRRHLMYTTRIQVQRRRHPMIAMPRFHATTGSAIVNSSTSTSIKTTGNANSLSALSGDAADQSTGSIATTHTETPPVGMMQYMKAYSELGKMKLSSLVVATTAAGYIAAGPIPFETNVSIFTATIIGTSFCSCCASGFNQIYEISRDKQMKRTQARPLVTGILTPYHATIMTSLWGILGTATLYHYTDPITTALGVGNIILYAGIYTPLKPITIYNTWIGAIVGAVPPVMGYTAATNMLYAHDANKLTETWSSSDLISSVASSPGISTELLSSYLTDPIAISLVSTLYFWQLPHFMALSYMYRIDYKRGGFMMVPIARVSSGSTNDDVICDKDLGSTDQTVHTDGAGERTAKIIVRYAWYLSMVPIFSTVMDVTSSMYLLESLVLNAYALRVAYKFRDEQTNQNARNVFLTSLWYLPCTLMLFLLHSKAWDDTVKAEDANTNRNMLTEFLSEQIHAIRNKGRELCIHEQAIVKSTGLTASKTLTVEKANGSNDGNITKENDRDENKGTRSEASCPVVIVRKTDPKNITIHHHAAGPVTITAARQPTSTTEE